MSEMQTKIFGLSQTDEKDGRELYEFLLLDDEKILLSYKSIRDRLIVIDVQGLRGKKKEFMIIPLSKITTFSCESAGTFDIDSEMKIWCSGVGKVEFEFVKDTDIKPLLKTISVHIL